MDLKAIAHRVPPRSVQVPHEDEEEDFTAPLAARPPVIPLRSSTPVTSLRLEEPARGDFHHGDGLGLVRGSLAPDAIENWFRTGERPSLDELTGKVDSGLGEQAVGRVAAEVDGMLDIFDASPLAETLRDGDTRAWFELPFRGTGTASPVHGTIDLAYETDGTLACSRLQDRRSAGPVAGPRLRRPTCLSSPSTLPPWRRPSVGPPSRG